MNSINATLAVINLFILEWEAFMMLLLTVGVVIITTLIGTLITAELSESAHS
ncbi:5'-methylthioadenosine nucleosidase [Lysinibacillus sp. A1]|nr:5'-methylthioadenosine nucleosidase [Lysinibacillus fusiformis]EAZ83755.1 5'-methylthioadenosine/S-adenosylhomocysteine nucleosidase [Bacillus sp. B14905]KEK12100.1 5'-methylthioadenosine nucleosidase [Lysinibacillus sphaericus]KHK54677.1 5'-methylthioadenosine nucleosidase [Lysinibacillus sp. A1]HAU34247.1 5'-methylthioadenosine nucleosidase [Lysinibacillus sp.]